MRTKTKLSILALCMTASAMLHAQPVLTPPIDPQLRQVIDSMHTRLKIRPEQEKAWMAFSTNLVPTIPRIDLTPDPKILKLPTPQRIDYLKKFRDQKLNEFTTLVDKMDSLTKAMYDVLDASQKATFDAYQFGLR